MSKFRQIVLHVLALWGAGFTCAVTLAFGTKVDLNHRIFWTYLVLVPLCAWLFWPFLHKKKT